MLFAALNPADHFHNGTIIFASIVWEALPFIILGALIAGILEEMVPQQWFARFMPRKNFLAIAMGSLLGIVFPMCECGIIPVMRRILRKGVPLSACVSYLLAGPIINVVVMLSTYMAFSPAKDEAQPVPNKGEEAQVDQAAFSPPKGDTQAVSRPGEVQLIGWQMASLRAGLGFLIAFSTGLLVHAVHRRYGDELLTPLTRPPKQVLSESQENGKSMETKPRGWLDRLSRISGTALHDLVEITLYLVLGALLAAISRESLEYGEVDVQAVSHAYPALAILSMMALAILLCVCSEADAFVAAGFRLMPASSKLAFLVLGPMLDLKLYLMYTRVFRPRLIWTIIISVVVQVFLFSMLTHWILVKWVAGIPSPTSP